MDSGLRLRSIRMKPGFAIDSLTNALTGLGTQFDSRFGNVYEGRELSQAEVASAYRGSGLMRKIINIPAMDMVREGWDWKADEAEITVIEDEQKRLGIPQKARLVEIMRGLGGGALILGLPGNPATPAPETVAKAGLGFVNVVSRWQLQFDKFQEDSREADYGQPLMYRMDTATRGQVEIHPSRVIPFRGEPIPALSGMVDYTQEFWGESRVAAVLDAVQDSDTARGAFAHLISRARNTRIGIPNLLASVATTEGEAAFRRRMRAFAMAETIFNATIFDSGDGDKGGETINDVQYNFAGVKDVMNAYGEWASAISDIPSTRLLGRAPEGMNSSGDSQQKDWAKRIRAMQTLDLSPCLDRLFHFLVRSALGSWPEGLWYDFPPLELPSEKEEAERFKMTMEAVDKLQGTGTIPDEAFAKGVQSLMIDEGWLPGLEDALDEIPEAERYGVKQEQEDPDELEPVMPRTPQLRLADATPRPLYVQRKLLNAAELIRWAKAQGFATTLPAEDMHVTVLYSRTPVDPMKLGEGWGGDEDGNLTVKPGGPRAIERLGEDAVVLLFASSYLTWRHRDMIEAGGSHDFPEYQPHVTISFEAPADMELDAIKPYAGELRFGPELFEPLNEDWKSETEEA